MLKIPSQAPPILGLGVHWLALAGVKYDPAILKKYTPVLKEANVTCLEMAWFPDISAKQFAKQLKAAGINAVAFCCFFGEDEDPLENSSEALARLTLAMGYGYKLRHYGIEFHGLTGPWAFEIGKDYADQKRILVHKKLVSFVQQVNDVAEAWETPCALEYLRKKEDKAIGGHQRLGEILNDARIIRIDAHIDTFHMHELKEDVEKVMRALPVGWIHFSGYKRYTPGARQEKFEWSKIIAKMRGQLLHSTQHRTKFGVYEGFSPAFREQVPAIGAGFPPDLPPEVSVPLMAHTLRSAGVIPGSDMDTRFLV